MNCYKRIKLNRFSGDSGIRHFIMQKWVNIHHTPEILSCTLTGVHTTLWEILSYSVCHSNFLGVSYIFHARTNMCVHFCGFIQCVKCTL